MTALDAARMGRTFAESLMTSTCTIARLADTATTDPETGAVTRARTPVWSGPCRVRPAGGGNQATSAEAGGAEVTSFDYLVSIPFSVSTVREGDRLTITASPDPLLIGRDLDVQKPYGGDNLSARRLACVEVN